MSSACDRPVQACILPLAHAQLAYCPEPEEGLRRYDKYEHLQLSTLLFYAYILTRLACEQCKSGSCVEKIASVFHALICDGVFLIINL